MDTKKVEGGERPVKKPRRRATPKDLHQIYDAISHWTNDVMRQQATIERIQAYLKSHFGRSEDDVIKIMKKCLDDALIVKESRQGCRGKNQGKMIEAYFVPVSVERDGWDWYCFICHGKGCVTGCTSCSRVYHPSCLPKEFRDESVPLKCPECFEHEKEKAATNYNLETLNKCLGFVCERVQHYLPENIYFRKLPEVSSSKAKSAQVDNLDEPFREAHILYEPMSIDRMMKKTLENSYSTISEFLTDAKAFSHNVHVFHFDDDPVVNKNCEAMTKMIKFLKALEHDADEIKNCVQCFVNSNEQPADWYCLPCVPPHSLVFAKQKGYCYWPAKVIRKTTDSKKAKYDVRFFGAPYERSTIEEAFIKPIDTPQSKLSLKRSVKLTSALAELDKHLKLLDGSSNPQVKIAEKTKIVSEGPPKKRMKTSKKQTSSKIDPVKVEETEERKEENVEPELPIEGKPDGPPDLDANRNSVTSSDNRNLSLEESSEDAVSSSNATNSPQRFFMMQMTNLQGEGSNAMNECLEQQRQKHLSDIAKLQQAHDEDILKLKEEHHQEVERIRQQHKLQIDETKAKIWCCQCFGEAILYCCWQTAYCSKECQHRHWMSEHKLKCRRSR